MRSAFTLLALLLPLTAAADTARTIDHARILVKDVLLQAPAGVGEIDLGPAPPPGGSRLVTRDEIQTHLARARCRRGPPDHPAVGALRCGRKAHLADRVRNLGDSRHRTKAPSRHHPHQSAAPPTKWWSPRALRCGPPSSPRPPRAKRELQVRRPPSSSCPTVTVVAKVPVPVVLEVSEDAARPDVPRGGHVGLTIDHRSVRISTQGSLHRRRQRRRHGERARARHRPRGQSAHRLDRRSPRHRGAVRRLAATISLASVMVACGPAHIAPFTPRTRKYAPGEYAIKQADAKPTNGSLYSEAMPGYLEDTRAVRVGDVVVVRIDEQANAQGDATTKLSKSTKREVGVDALLGLVPALKKAHPDIDPRSSSSSRRPAISRRRPDQPQRQLTGNIAVRVSQQMPNGDLFIEGTKVVMINHEEIHLYISGLVRRADIAGDNSVASSRIADAQVEFTGRGDIADTVDRGWLTKILDSINPF